MVLFSRPTSHVCRRRTPEWGGGVQNRNLKSQSVGGGLETPFAMKRNERKHEPFEWLLEYAKSPTNFDSQ